MSVLFPSWLPVFLAVAEHGSFNKAAEVLLLSQPAVSQKIRHLEASLGVQLFERTPSGARLTPAGETLHRYAHAARWILLAAEGSITYPHPAAHVRRRLLLGGTPSLAAQCFPRWLKAFHQRHPQTLVHLQTDTTPRLVQQVARHALHLAIIEGELPDESEVHYTILQELPFQLVAPNQPPWNTRQSVPLRALHKTQFVARPADAQTRRWMERIFAQHHIRPHIVAELDSPETIKQAVAHGMGVSLLPTCFLRDAPNEQLLVLPVEDVPLQRYLKAIWAKDMPMHPLALAFLETLQAEFPHLSQVLAAARHPDFRALYALLEDARTAPNNPTSTP